MDDKITLLGFYNRKNTGDDAYVECFKSLFPPNIRIDYYCMDDIEEIPSDTTIIVCGGGDIINDYFMEKARHLIANFTGPVYAVSVGIPYISGAKYLKMFDHVFVRSRQDYDIAAKEIGSKNVSLSGDISTMMRVKPSKIKLSYKHRIALCLAQPVFNQNPQLQEDLIEVLKRYPDYEFHLLAFNYNTSNPLECDHIINANLKQALPNLIIPVIPQDDPFSLLLYINDNVDACICMRYHSIMFSLLTNKRIIPFYCSQKVSNLVQDVKISSYVEIDSTTYTFDKEKLSSLIADAAIIPIVQYLPSYPTSSQDIRNYILTKSVRSQMIQHPSETVEMTLSKCISSLSKYFHISLADAEFIMNHVGQFTSPDPSKQSIDIARFICYTITGSTDHPCLWGLVANMTSKSSQLFCLRDAVKYIYNDVHKSSTYETVENYLPVVPNLQRRCFIKVDSFLRNNFASYHRSGWAYCISGLQQLDNTLLDRDAQSSIYVDSYIDRTFHWGYDTMKAIGALPYKSPWLGFIHHTFDTTHSMYNVQTLIAKEDFQESLKCCKGIIVLSRYLAEQLRSRIPDIPIHVLYHPTEFPSKTFSMSRFISGKGGVIQIGAWLRNPYSIYSLYSPLLKKMALKGKEMDLYFPPENYQDMIDSLNTSNNESLSASTLDIQSICRCFHNTNKFLKGATDLLKDHVGSVQVLERVSNEVYDDLLQKNIVFLDLVDCSAANTVIECIVRNTPIIVKRHPALEEVLGPNYPGFYSTLYEASTIIQSYDSIRVIHGYLVSLDKTRFTLSYFINSFQNILVPNELVLKKEVMFRFQFLKRFLPSSFKAMNEF